MSVPSSEPADRPSHHAVAAHHLGGRRRGSRSARLPGAARLAGNERLAARTVGLGLGLPASSCSSAAILTLRRHGTTVLPDAGATVLVTEADPTGVCAIRSTSPTSDPAGARRADQERLVRRRCGGFAVLVTWLAIRPEERHLEMRFGEAYLDYKAKTRRWL